VDFLIHRYREDYDGLRVINPFAESTTSANT